MKLEFLDTTLRDGAQSEGISFSTADKSNILNLLDEFGIDLIEGGEPQSNPKDTIFFATEHNSKMVAFGSTRHRDNRIEVDSRIIKLLESDTKTVCIVGKSSLSQAELVLQVCDRENLDMISESVAYLKAHGKRVIFDGEHFFDGYKENPTYAMTTLVAAFIAGADTLTLCDTNGGTSPQTIFDITKTVVDSIDGAKIGIHAHNDTGMAVASTLYAVKAGATHIQGTFLGFGERCGNANLSTIIANLALKEKYELDVKLDTLTSVAHSIAEISNITLNPTMPYVGSSAFSHKAGMHSDAVLKDSESFEHISPAIVGNKHRLLLSEMAGRSVVAKKLEHFFPTLDKFNPKTQEILDAIKQLELDGYQFESADGSFMLLAIRMMGNYTPSFLLEHYQIKSTKPDGENLAEISITVGDSSTTVGESGNGPVNALDKALRSALCQYYPQISEVSLVDYKVRTVDSDSATGAKVRVLITSSDHTSTWTTVGVSTDIIEASFAALTDSFEYKLIVKGGVAK